MISERLTGNVALASCLVLSVVGCTSTPDPENIVAKRILEQSTANKIEYQEGSIVGIDYFEPHLDLDLLDNLVALPKLKRLTIRNTSLSQSHIRRISQCRNLESLSLDNTKVKSDELESISTLTNLRNLGISKSDLHCDLLAEIVKLPYLESLGLPFSKIDDDGFSIILRQHRLRSLCLAYNHITDTNIHQLSQLHELRTLDLTATMVTDVGIKALSSCRLPELRTLYLGQTSVTDNAIMDIAIMCNLSEIWLVRTKMTEHGIHRLHQLLPKCRIFPMIDEDEDVIQQGPGQQW